MTHSHDGATPALACRDVIGALGDHVDGTLGFAMQADVEAHVAGCRRCLAYLAGYRATVRLVRALGRACRECGGTLPEHLVRSLLADGVRA